MVAFSRILNGERRRANVGGLLRHQLGPTGKDWAAIWSESTGFLIFSVFRVFVADRTEEEEAASQVLIRPFQRNYQRICMTYPLKIPLLKLFLTTLTPRCPCYFKAALPADLSGLPLINPLESFRGKFHVISFSATCFLRFGYCW